MTKGAGFARKPDACIHATGGARPWNGSPWFCGGEWSEARGTVAPETVDWVSATVTACSRTAYEAAQGATGCSELDKDGPGPPLATHGQEVFACD